MFSFRVVLLLCAGLSVLVTSASAQCDAKSRAKEDIPKIYRAYVTLIRINIDGRIRTCTGTFIYQQTAITAAHCFMTKYGYYQLSSSYVQMYANTVFFEGGKDEMTDMSVTSIRAHWYHKKWRADVALLYTYYGIGYWRLKLIAKNDPMPPISEVQLFVWERIEEAAPKIAGSAKTYVVQGDRYRLVRYPFRAYDHNFSMNLLRTTDSEQFYLTDGRDIVCYTSDYRALCDTDSGAPVIWKKKLLAVTVGGIYCYGKDLGVGMKISCYCEWIAKNLRGAYSIAGWKLSDYFMKDLECCLEVDCCHIKALHKHKKGGFFEEYVGR